MVGGVEEADRGGGGRGPEGEEVVEGAEGGCWGEGEGDC